MKNDFDENKTNENPIILNAYLSAIIKFLSGENNDNEQEYEYMKELNSVTETMLNLKLADLYTQNILLTYYSVLISKNNKNELYKENDNLIQKCLDLWNHEYLIKIREKEVKNISFDNISLGLKISFSLIVKCLLTSLNTDNKDNTTKLIDKNTSNKDINNISNSKDTKDTEDLKSSKNLKNQKYMREAFKLSLQLPTDEVISSFLFSIGFSKEKLGTALGCMKLLNEKQMIMKNKIIVDNCDNSENQIISSTETLQNDKNKLKNDNKNDDKNDRNYDSNNMNVKIVSNDVSPINCLDSLLSGYYDAMKYDSVIEAYLISYGHSKR